MALFEVPVRPGKDKDNAIATRLKNKTKTTITRKGGGSLISRITTIVAEVEKNLGQYRDIYQCIQNKEILHDFITECIGNGYIAIDTETTGLDPLRDTLVGICPYTPGQKSAYIPLNHISYITQDKVANQLDMDFVMAEFKRLLEKRPDIDMFNAPFDCRFLRHNGLSDIYCTWDGSIGTRILNENELHNNLKQLHNKYCLDGKGDAFRFDDLFKGISFDFIPINTAYLYAAHDPEITNEYCEFQRQHLRPDAEREDMRQLYHVFKNIEMPCVDVVIDMEDAGILFDFDYNNKLKEKYHGLLDERRQEFLDVCKPYKSAIDGMRLNGVKLDDPINIKSPSQLAVLLYDIMECDLFYDKRAKKYTRSTSEEQLLSLNNDVSKAILRYREFETIVSTFIDKLPECVNPEDGRIHCKFNQYGADTGRFSSKDPNMQNIPSHNKDIRKMFIASKGYVLMSSDFSQQEPKSLAALCKKQGDSQMYDTFMAGKDLYSEIASKAFNKSYDECKEFNADGTTNKAGKERRTQAKSILLGVLYGRGEASIAEQLGCTTEEAEQIKSSVFRAFPAIKKFEDDSLTMAKELGYVTTVCGRKRRLPDLQLPEYDFKWTNGVSPEEDLLDFDSEIVDIDEDTRAYYLRKLSKLWGKKKAKVVEEAARNGITVVDNTMKIADATRQCVNARVQGSAADLTKLAMIKLHDNKRLKELGFRILIPVHDEVIAECPIENAKECSELLANTMSKAAEEILEMPIKCDVAVSYEWYGEELNVDEL